MTTKIAIPRNAHQTALNISNMSGKAAMCLNGSASYQSLAHAEVMAKRSMDDARELVRIIRKLKSDAMAATKRDLQERNVLQRASA